MRNEISSKMEDDYYIDKENRQEIIGNVQYESRDFIGYYNCKLIKMKNDEYALIGYWVNAFDKIEKYKQVVKVYKDDLSLIRDTVRLTERSKKDILNKIIYLAIKNIVELKKENEKLKKKISI